MTRAPLRWRALLALLRILPQGGLSRSWGWLAARRLPSPLQGLVNRGFAMAVGVDLSEAERPPEAYASLSTFFVRRLRPGLREWPGPPGLPGSPVDGIVGAHGAFEGGSALQAKGIEYSVNELLQGTEGDRFASGLFLTIYLSPRHYHRIHAPIGGEIFEARAIPGRLLPVNLPAVGSVHDLFPRNERLVVLLKRGGVDMALVAVGAYNVGSISTTFDPSWSGTSHGGVTNRPGRRRAEIRRYGPALDVARGEELMAFHLGSTVVLLMSAPESELPPFRPELREGAEVRLGTPLLEHPLR